MTSRTIRIWVGMHSWSSLICTVFLILLCLTGLPLIFHEQIDEFLGDTPDLPVMAAGTPAISLDEVVSAARARRPGEVPLYLSWDPDERARLYVTMADAPNAPASQMHSVMLDGRTAAVLGEPGSKLTFIRLMFRLHVDLFAGLPGKLFLGAMGLLFLAAIVSGVVLYAPFMRRLPFGAVRQQRQRTRWLDLHNLLGVTALVWMIVVGATGVINTWADLVIQLWQRNELADMIAPYRGLPPLTQLGSVQLAVTTVQVAVPGMAPRFIAFPGTPYSSAHHYAVFLNGDTPLTSRLLTPALVDAATLKLTAVRALPWYAKVLFLSEPLHFGDYGGMILKVIWALLDLATLVVLGSGVYLWFSRRRARSGSSSAVRQEHAA